MIDFSNQKILATMLDLSEASSIELAERCTATELSGKQAERRGGNRLQFLPDACAISC